MKALKTYFVLFEPVQIIKEVPGHGAGWWLSGKADQTTIQRLIVAPVACFVNPWLPLLFEFGEFFQAGTSNEHCIEIGCKQGGNILDLLAVVIWSVIWFVFKLPYWI